MVNETLQFSSYNDQNEVASLFLHRYDIYYNLEPYHSAGTQSAN